jgi:hypothetical protein
LGKTANRIAVDKMTEGEMTVGRFSIDRNITTSSVARVKIEGIWQLIEFQAEL